MKTIISGKFELINEDLKKVLTGAAIAAIGAFLTFFAEGIKGIDFGQWTPFVAAAVAALVNLIRKWITEEKYTIPK